LQPKWDEQQYKDEEDGADYRGRNSIAALGHLVGWRFPLRLFAFLQQERHLRHCSYLNEVGLANCAFSCLYLPMEEDTPFPGVPERCYIAQLDTLSTQVKKGTGKEMLMQGVNYQSARFGVDKSD
jgi:hypothetical protein